LRTNWPRKKRRGSQSRSPLLWKNLCSIVSLVLKQTAACRRIPVPPMMIRQWNWLRLLVKSYSSPTVPSTKRVCARNPASRQMLPAECDIPDFCRPRIRPLHHRFNWT
jgi:hypothetical protein